MPRPAAHHRWIDRLRVSVIAAVIAVHTATAYVVPIPWYYQERTTSTLTPVLLGWPVVLLAAFGLSPLFLVAGMLAADSLARRGPAGFAAARLLRLGVPAVLYVLVVDPLIRWWVARTEGESRSLVGALTDFGQGRGFGPLWFAVALLGFSLLYAGWRSFRPAVPNKQEAIGFGPLLLVAAGIAATDLLTWPHLPDTVDRYWNFEWPHWQQTAGVFVLGVLAGERGWFRELPPRLVRFCRNLAVPAVAGLSVLAAFAVRTEPSVITSGYWQGVVMALLDGFTVVMLMIWLVDVLQRRWAGPTSAITAGAAHGSYAAYLLHPVVLVGLSLILRAPTWPPEVKMLLVVAVGVPACFLVGDLMTRLPGVKRVL